MADDKKKELGIVTFKDVRASYLHIYEPQEQTDEETGKVTRSYNGNVLIPKETEEGEAILKIYNKIKDEVFIAKWGADKSKWPKLKPEKLCLRDGDLEDAPEYMDHWYISFRSQESDPPLLLLRTRDSEGKWEFSTKSNEIYSGCFVNIKLQFWAMDNKYGKRFNASGLALQFNRHGQAFSGKPKVTRDNSFDDIEEMTPGDEEDYDFGSKTKGTSSSKSTKSGKADINYDDL